MQVILQWLSNNLSAALDQVSIGEPAYSPIFRVSIAVSDCLIISTAVDIKIVFPVHGILVRNQASRCAPVYRILSEILQHFEILRYCDFIRQG
jgi:hypothetical protein